MLCTVHEIEQNGMEQNKNASCIPCKPCFAMQLHNDKCNAAPLRNDQENVMTRNKKNLITFPTLLILLTPQYSQTDPDPVADPCT
jgi:hypothetical protein